jgi:hypothetical protein
MRNCFAVLHNVVFQARNQNIQLFKAIYYPLQRTLVFGQIFWNGALGTNQHTSCRGYTNYPECNFTLFLVTHVFADFEFDYEVLCATLSHIMAFS